MGDKTRKYKIALNMKVEKVITIDECEFETETDIASYISYEIHNFLEEQKAEIQDFYKLFREE